MHVEAYLLHRSISLRTGGLYIYLQDIDLQEFEHSETDLVDLSVAAA